LLKLQELISVCDVVGVSVTQRLSAN